jgi:hypothetical protein
MLLLVNYSRKHGETIHTIKDYVAEVIFYAFEVKLYTCFYLAYMFEILNIIIVPMAAQ